MSATAHNTSLPDPVLGDAAERSAALNTGAAATVREVKTEEKKVAAVKGAGKRRLATYRVVGVVLLVLGLGVARVVPMPKGVAGELALLLMSMAFSLAGIGMILYASIRSSVERMKQ